MAIRGIFLFGLVLLAAGCLRDETISAYGPGLWILDRVNGEPAQNGITLEIATRGRISGHAHCNGYSARQTAPYPWIAIDTITTTERACDQIEEEAGYLSMLLTMTLAEASGPVLILSNDTGESLTYIAYQP